MFEAVHSEGLPAMHWCIASRSVSLCVNMRAWHLHRAPLHECTSELPPPYPLHQSASVMPVTFNVASHPANVHKSNTYISKPLRAHDIVDMACQDQSTKVGMLLGSSANDEELEGTVPVSNGFVHAMLTAYGSHHHLRIRCVHIHCVRILNNGKLNNTRADQMTYG